VGWECVWGGHAPRSVFAEDVVKAGCLDDVLGGHDPPRAGPHPDVLLMHIKPLGPGALDGLVAGAHQGQKSVNRWSEDIVPHCCRFQT
jgi:hypothetical protein